MYHKCEICVNEGIQGKSNKIHKVPIAVKSNGMYIAIGFNKTTGNPVAKREIVRFYKIADDVKKGYHGTQLTDAIYGSSIGFNGEALVHLENLSKSRKDDPENILNFKTAAFENRIYLVTKC